MLTHHHLDHSGGIADLLAYGGNVPVFASNLSPVKQVTHYVMEGDLITCLSWQLKVLAIPGHTNDHIAYYDEDILFCGDTLFSAGCGKIFEGTAEQMYGSLQKLAQLNNHIKIYCGHEYTSNNLYFAQQVEPQNRDITQKITAIAKLTSRQECTLPSLLAEEKKINPFLRCAIPEVAQAAEKYAGRKLTSEVEIFYTLREWKNLLNLIK